MSDILQRLPQFLGNHLMLSLGFVGVLGALIYFEIGQRFLSRLQSVDASRPDLADQPRERMVFDVASCRTTKKAMSQAHAMSP